MLKIPPTITLLETKHLLLHSSYTASFYHPRMVFCLISPFLSSFISITEFKDLRFTSFVKVLRLVGLNMDLLGKTPLSSCLNYFTSAATSRSPKLSTSFFAWIWENIICVAFCIKTLGPVPYYWVPCVTSRNYICPRFNLIGWSFL